MRSVESVKMSLILSKGVDGWMDDLDRWGKGMCLQDLAQYCKVAKLDQNSINVVADFRLVGWLNSNIDSPNKNGRNVEMRKRCILSTTKIRPNEFAKL